VLAQRQHVPASLYFIYRSGSHKQQAGSSIPPAAGSNSVSQTAAASRQRNSSQQAKVSQMQPAGIPFNAAAGSSAGDVPHDFSETVF